ncbi:MAG TPA: hypothetical protein VES20_23405 [Bryobacteraceae bacterium]|nr:hypothetical protein [Bryobacteraceae bacterium]
MTEIRELHLTRTVLSLISGWLALFLAGASSVLKRRTALQLENVALRHQISVLQRSAKKRPHLHAADRLLWVWMSPVWADWRSSLVIVKPETVMAWHRNAFRSSGRGRSVETSPAVRRSQATFATSFVA